MLTNQVPNMNQYQGAYPQTHLQANQRFGFLPFVGGLAVGALAGGIGRPPYGYYGPRPVYGPGCMPAPMCPPMMVAPQPLPYPVPVQTCPQQAAYMNQVVVR